MWGRLACLRQFAARRSGTALGGFRRSALAHTAVGAASTFPTVHGGALLAGALGLSACASGRQPECGGDTAPGASAAGAAAPPLLGRVALVTGGSSGIGAGTAIQLAEAGADVCINYVGDAAPAELVASQIRRLGRRALVAEADVSKRDAVVRMFEAAQQELGPVSILVTNAVVSTRSNILETKASDMQRTLDVGIMGAFHCMQVAAWRMLAAEVQGGCIVHITSPHYRAPLKEAIDYNVAKAGAHHLALSAANELMWRGIRVNMVQPGWTLTEGEIRLFGRSVVDKAGSKMPLGRLTMPDDIGSAVVWLCSDAASQVVGACITVDGGQFIETAPSWRNDPRHED